MKNDLEQKSVLTSNNAENMVALADVYSTANNVTCQEDDSVSTNPETVLEENPTSSTLNLL